MERVQVMEELKQYFRPEFLNRLDEIIVFRQLTKSEVKQIADIMLKGVVDRAKEKEITIDLTERYVSVPTSVAYLHELLELTCHNSDPNLT
jgi:ATP-dependent Clp protease ATP-binding subunit ClpA